MGRWSMLAVAAALWIAVAGVASAQPRSAAVPERPREGTRVRVERADGTVIEGRLAPRPAPSTPPVGSSPAGWSATDAPDRGGDPYLDDALAVDCRGCGEPVRIPYCDVVTLQVYDAPSSRMDTYAGLGALLGLGIGLLLDMPGAVTGPCPDGDCGPEELERADRDATRVLALTAVGMAAGAILGLVTEGSGVWQAVALDWDPDRSTTQLQVAFAF